MKEAILGVWEGIDSTLLGVHPERCICIRNKNAHCMRCAEVCTTGAIAFDGETLSLDPDRCIGCGTCATACPTCALEAKNPTDRELSAACAAKISSSEGSLELRCSSNVGGGEASGEVPDVMCMGRLDESLFVEMALRGCKRVVLHTGDCAACPHAHGGALAREVASSVSDLLAAFGRTLDVSFDERSGFDPDEASDTSLIGERVAVDHPEPARFEHVGEGGTLSHHAPSRRARLFKLLDLLGKPQRDTARTRLWGEASIDVDACSSCRMCAVFCPTGALRKVGVIDGRLGVEHRPALCVQCRLCESICPKSAIGIADEVSLSKFESGYFERIEMRELDWIPNRADSIWRKTANDIGGNYTVF